MTINAKRKRQTKQKPKDPDIKNDYIQGKDKMMGQFINKRSE